MVADLQSSRFEFVTHAPEIVCMKSRTEYDLNEHVYLADFLGAPVYLSKNLETCLVNKMGYMHQLNPDSAREYILAQMTQGLIANEKLKDFIETLKRKRLPHFIWLAKLVLKFSDDKEPHASIYLHKSSQNGAFWYITTIPMHSGWR